MPSREADELRALDADELETRLADAKQELFNLRFQLATGQLDNNARVAQVKKQIARVHTVLREQELEAYEAVGAAEADHG